MKQLAVFSESDGWIAKDVETEEKDVIGNWIMWLEEADFSQDAMRYGWARDSQQDPTLVLMRHNGEKGGEGSYMRDDKEWGFVSPGSAIVAKWRSQRPFAPMIDMAQLSNKAKEIFGKVEPVPTTPRLMRDDFTGQHMEPPDYGDEDDIGIFDSPIAKFLLSAFGMMAIVGIIIVMISEG